MGNARRLCGSKEGLTRGVVEKIKMFSLLDDRALNEYGRSGGANSKLVNLIPEWYVIHEIV